MGDLKDTEKNVCEYVMTLEADETCSYGGR